MYIIFIKYCHYHLLLLHTKTPLQYQEKKTLPPWAASPPVRPNIPMWFIVLYMTNDQDHMRDEQGSINYILKKSKSLSKFRTKNKNFAIWAFGLQHSKKAFNK